MIALLRQTREYSTSVVTGAIVILLVAAPLGVSAYWIVILTSALAYCLLAISITLVAGHAGLITLAHSAYAGVGAYAAALTSRHLTSNGLAQLGLAVLGGVVVATATGWIALRASKTYFLMLSLAVGELLHILATQWRAVTNGGDGLSAGAPFELAPGTSVVLAAYVYWSALAVFLVFAGLVLVVVRSPFGSALRGIRDNEHRMRSLGYATGRYKYAVWIFSGAVAGAAGWIFVAQLPRFVTPAQMSFHIAGLVLLAVVIGGLESMWGACVGAAAVLLMTNVVSQDLGGRGPLVLGVMFVCAVYLLPHGLAGIGRNKRVGTPA